MCTPGALGHIRSSGVSPAATFRCSAENAVAKRPGLAQYCKFQTRNETAQDWKIKNSAKRGEDRIHNGPVRV
jgi:hypothetical protein